jgi:hypothetical protein
MFERLKRWAGPKPKRETLAKLPEITWVPADKNPWHVPVLDVRKVTQYAIAASSDPKVAANAVSFGQDDGLSFATCMPETTRTVLANLQYRIDRFLAPGALFVPHVMEDQWALYFHNEHIICVRSWTRKVVATAEVQFEGNSLMKIATIQGTLLVRDEEPSFTLRVLNFLLRTHALGTLFPAPLPAGMENLPEQAASWCMSAFGRRAAFATSHPVEIGIPEKPLRSVSLLHMAVARGDVDGIDKYLRLGLPIDLLAADGLAPMHWAALRDDADLLQYLIGRGALVDVRGAKGETPLMITAQGENLANAKFLIERGADVNATDLRGFVSLHRAVELDKLEMVKFLLNQGARADVVAEGYSPLSYAELRGNVEIVHVLRGSRAGRLR